MRFGFRQASAIGKSSLDCASGRSQGNLISDAILRPLAMESGAEWITRIVTTRGSRSALAPS